MAFCSNCGNELAPGAKFCSECGSPVNGTQKQRRREQEYAGKIIKCPNCGEILDSFVTRCPACGYELRGAKVDSPVSELAKRIEDAASTDEKIELITNFYVPNTKEDIYEFFILAVSNLEDNRYDTDDAWQAKLEQTYHKAKISFGNTPEFDYIEQLYKRTIAKISKRGFSNFVRRNKIACATALLIGAGVLVMLLGIVLWLSSPELTFISGMGGIFFIILGINFILSPTWVLEGMKKKESAEKRDRQKRNCIRVQSVGKNADELVHEYYEDVVEQLRILGFENIVLKAEKKGVFDREGTIKGISIAGNSQFGEDDEFDKDAKIIIRYYSNKF